jgi:hypothetical protein
MTRACLGPKSSNMRFGYSYFTGHEVFNLWFVKHMLRNCIRINFNHSRCLWWGQWEIKASKYHNFWRFIKLAIPTSLCEGPFFYFYVESPPSTFMHRLREHSCHSEYIVHSPKVYHWLIDSWLWFCLFLNYFYLVALVNLMVSYAFMFCYSMKDKLKTTWYVFPYDLNTRLTFIVSLLMIFHLCFFSCYNMVAKFYCQDYVSYAHVLSTLISALNALPCWSRLWWCMSPQKLLFCYHLPTRGRAGVKLGDAWYVSNVSIIFDAPCLFIHHLLCVLLHFVAFLCIFRN